MDRLEFARQLLFLSSILAGFAVTVALSLLAILTWSLRLATSGGH